jgi:hypothetical protein
MHVLYLFFLFLLLKVSATDSDGFYNQITYSIITGNDGKFVINSTTGEIQANATLDRETSSQFILTVRAQDSKYSPSFIHAQLRSRNPFLYPLLFDNPTFLYAIKDND